MATFEDGYAATISGEISAECEYDAVALPSALRTFNWSEQGGEFGLRGAPKADGCGPNRFLSFNTEGNVPLDSLAEHFPFEIDKYILFDGKKISAEDISESELEVVDGAEYKAVALETLGHSLCPLVTSGKITLFQAEMGEVSFSSSLIEILPGGCTRTNLESDGKCHIEEWSVGSD